MLSIECDIPKSTIHAMLNTLAARRFVTYHGAGKGWAAGPRLGELSHDATLLIHGVAVLEACASLKGELTPTQLARAADLPLPIARRALATLAERGLLHESEEGRFSLGLRLVSLASRIDWLDRLRIVARPTLTRLRDTTLETANLVVRDGDHALYVDQVPSRYALRHIGWVGQRIPLQRTATGAALADPGTAVVMTDAVEDGVTAIACALPEGSEAAALSITAPTFRMSGSSVRRACEMLERAASELAAAI
jgi:DNA-binding IclR family transcriptional regulator